MTDEFINKIKSRGFWRINFQPLIDKQKLDTLTQCREVIERNEVKLRGWDYPHYPRRTGDDTGLDPCVEYYQGWIDWWNHKEFWRMYKSGQFLHYLALREDWFEESEWDASLAEKIKPKVFLGVIGSIIYQLTEIFEFLSRLTKEGLYDEGVRVSITLYNTKGRQLWVEDPHRAPLFTSYTTGAEIIAMDYEYSTEKVLSDPKGLAFKLILEVFDAFGWENPPIETIKKDQENILSGKV